MPKTRLRGWWVFVGAAALMISCPREGAAPDEADAAGERSTEAAAPESRDEVAPAAVDAEYCEKVWPSEAEPDPEGSLACARHWLVYAYGDGRRIPEHEEGLVGEPLYGRRIAIQTGSEKLERMAAHARDACGRRCDVVLDEEADPDIVGVLRAIEYFEGEARWLRDTLDTARMERIDELLDKVLAGEPLDGDDLRGWTPVSLWKLRNAVFARHGREFRHADLQAFFYGPDRVRPRLEVDSEFDASRLTATDRKNVSRIQAAEARAPGP